MPEDLMRYDQLAQEALRGVVRNALRRVAKSGLPGEHHFYIAFNTKHPGVNIGARMSERYPREMTVVIQHQFWNLIVTEDHFEVELSFDNIPEKLIIPFSAIKGFLDPSVQFGLQFEVVNLEEKPEGKPAVVEKSQTTVKSDLYGKSTAPDTETDSADKPKVVSLDAFRKK